MCFLTPGSSIQGTDMPPVHNEFCFYLGICPQNRNDIKNGSILRLTTSPVSLAFRVHQEILLQSACFVCTNIGMCCVCLFAFTFPLPFSSPSSTRQQSSFMSESSRPAWMPSWRLWRTWPTLPGTSPLPRNSSTWTASPCLLKWWRVGLSKSTALLFAVLEFLFGCCVFFPQTDSHSSLCVECNTEQ